MDRFPDAMRCQRHIEMAYAVGFECVDDGVDHRRRRADRRRLADALGAQRIERRLGDGFVDGEGGKVIGARHGVIHHRAGQQLALLVEDDLFQQCLANALRQAAVDLPLDQQRADARTAIINRVEFAQVDDTGVGIDFDHGDMGAEGVDEVGRAEEIGGFQAGVDVIGQVVRIGASRRSRRAPGCGWARL